MARLTWEVPEGAWALDFTPGESALQISTADATNDPPFQATLPLVSWTDVEGAPSDLIWVERIVGEVCIFGTGGEADGVDGGGRLVQERIHVGFEVPSAVLTTYSSLSDELDAQERFLWTRSLLRPCFATGPIADNGFGPNAFPFVGLDSYSQPHTFVVDVRVGRALRTPMVLGYSMQLSTVGVDETWYLYAWLRLLVRRS